MSVPKDLVGKTSRRMCPGAFANLGGKRPTANRNAPPLRRWKATWEALSTELTGEGPATGEEDSFDPVQAAIVAAQIKRAEPLLPAREGGDFDLDWPRLSSPIGDQELEVFFQFVHADPDGFLKMYRLKTAQIRRGEEFVSAPEEIAAVVSDPRFPDSLEAYEMRTADGEMIRLEMPPAQARETLRRLESDYQAMAEADPGDIRPGLHCSMCEVADLCRTFPAIDPSMEKVAPHRKPRLHSVYRLMLSKSRLGDMDSCQRRAAWRAWFFIPADLDHRSREPSPALAVGNRFHSLMAEALLSADPGSFFLGDPEMEPLYLQHQNLPCDAPVRVKATEFPLGFAVRFRVDGHSVSVVSYGLADAVGREPDGTPAAVDHKTGRSVESNPHEAEIYALGALLRFPNSPAVATHIHRLAIGKDPVCERVVWERDRIRDLVTRLGGLAETAARWDLLDATSPPFRVGEWCGTCPFEQRCVSFR
ncbi:MAG: PD-(D/E)XK nuclease family protein [Acidimicrobiia bacterium]|nr:PD-(D/E)XK nuclease family protein [Acidimicrobiia bacterium]